MHYKIFVEKKVDFQGKYEDAIKECTKAVELNPSYLKAFLRRGDNHEKLEQYEEAIAGNYGLCWVVCALQYIFNFHILLKVAFPLHYFLRIAFLKNF